MSLSGATMVALLCLAVAFAPHRVAGGETNHPGLIGAQFGETDLKNWQRAMLLTTLEQSWAKEDDYGRQWSARWQGFVVAPASGEITFHAETEKTVHFRVGEQKIIELKPGEKQRSGVILMEKGRAYPVEVTFVNHQGHDSSLTIQWSWAGQDKVSIPASNLGHTVEQQRSAGWPAEDLNSGNSQTVEAKSTVQPNK